MGSAVDTEWLMTGPDPNVKIRKERLRQDSPKETNRYVPVMKDEDQV